MFDIFCKIAGLLFGLIGLISSVYFLYEKLYPMKRISWKSTERIVKRIVNEMISHDFSPTLIVGIGRGGAIMGSLISGCLGHRPLIVVDRMYSWVDGDRKEDMLCKMNVPQAFFNRVLLVSGEVHSGNTMKFYYEYLKEIGAKDVKRATLFYETGATVNIEYKGIESSRKNTLMPWMFSETYIRQDRRPCT
jgi:hypoxanthine phosphoribosyltransferase